MNRNSASESSSRNAWVQSEVVEQSERSSELPRPVAEEQPCDRVPFVR